MLELRKMLQLTPSKFLLQLPLWRLGGHLYGTICGLLTVAQRPTADLELEKLWARELWSKTVARVWKSLQRTLSTDLLQ